jgi:hypothetical protein
MNKSCRRVWGVSVPGTVRLSRGSWPRQRREASFGGVEAPSTGGPPRCVPLVVCWAIPGGGRGSFASEPSIDV